ncbi:MAG: HD domain-containing protein [Endomicrobiales bacterium]
MKKNTTITKKDFIDMLLAPSTAQMIQSVENVPALQQLFPEITSMKKSAKRFYFHPNGLWQHAIETLENIEIITRSIKKMFPHNYEAITKHINSPAGKDFSHLSLLKLTALFHDVAKPLCARKSGTRMRFIGHEQQGARIMGKISKRLGLSKEVIDQSRLLVEHHMRPISLTQAEVLTPRATKRFFTALGNNVPDLLLLALADWSSYKRLESHDNKQLKRQETVVRELMKRYYSVPLAPPTGKIINGSMVMKHFNLSSGPLIGAALKLVGDAQKKGKISTAKEALALIKPRLTLLKKRYKIKRKIESKVVRA